MSHEPGKIRNVAVVGHRGTGKTSLVEALLFQAGAINRLGTVEAGTTVSDWDDDEHKRQMSLAASLTHLEWHGGRGQHRSGLGSGRGAPALTGRLRQHARSGARRLLPDAERAARAAL